MPKKITFYLSCNLSETDKQRKLNKVVELFIRDLEV